MALSDVVFSATGAIAAVSLLLVYIIALGVYRLYFHPLAKFPGPKIAALTLWYEFYYDTLKGGGGLYIWEIENMHKIYGPVVRISPNELHSISPDFLDEIYAGGNRKRDKYEYMVRMFGVPGSTFATVDHDKHRMRRRALNKFFSKAAALKLEPVIRAKVDLLCSGLESHAGSGRPVHLTGALSCLTTDVITEYLFGTSWDYLSSPDFGTNLDAAIITQTGLTVWTKHYPWLLKLVDILPDRVTLWLLPSMDEFLKYMNHIDGTVKKMKTQTREELKVKNDDHPTIFQALLEGDIPESEKEFSRMKEEAVVLIGAGSGTVAWTLSVMTYYLLTQPEKLAKLQAEIRTVMPEGSDLPSCTALEELQYLDATLQESLRLGHGIATRLARSAPDEVMHLRSADGRYSYDIPPGTPIGTHNAFLHLNPDIFPDPHAFAPERWLDESGRREGKRKLDGSLLAFSKGSRMCIGMNLAYLELRIAAAALVMRLGDRMELFETTVEDVKLHKDRFMVVPIDGSTGVKVLVK